MTGHQIQHVMEFIDRLFISPIPVQCKRTLVYLIDRTPLILDVEFVEELLDNLGLHKPVEACRTRGGQCRDKPDSREKGFLICQLYPLGLTNIC